MENLARNEIGRAQGETGMFDYYSVAARSFQEHLERIEKAGRKDSPDWYLANGLLLLAQGLQHDREAEEDRRKSFARSWTPPQNERLAAIHEEHLFGIEKPHG